MKGSRVWTASRSLEGSFVESTSSKKRGRSLWALKTITNASNASDTESSGTSVIRPDASDHVREIMRCFTLCIQSTVSLANLRTKALQRFNFPARPFSQFPSAPSRDFAAFV
jgi:hypothetical protein